MSDIINSRSIIKDLIKNGLNVEDKQQLSYYVSNFNYNIFLKGYGKIFIGENKRFDKEATDTQIIALYNFDMNMSNHILRWILQIEKIISTNVVYEAINYYNIKDHCLLKLNTDTIKNRILKNLYKVTPKISYENFLYKMVKYLPSNEISRDYVEHNKHDDIYKWRNCPLDIMCLTWSFSTTFSFMIALNEELRDGILSTFGLKAEHIQGFYDFIKNLIDLRNGITHNEIIFSKKIKYQSNELKAMYQFITKKSISNELKLINILEIIEFLTKTNKLVNSTKYWFKKLNIKTIFKNKVDMICGKIGENKYD